MGRREYLRYKESARLLVWQKIVKFNAIYKFLIKRVAIKNHKSRWGSCSKRGNLNFNYKIVLLPEDMADYIIVHELCHLGQFNHSSKFWELVGRTLPEYKIIKKKFKKLIIK